MEPRSVRETSPVPRASDALTTGGGEVSRSVRWAGIVAAVALGSACSSQVGGTPKADYAPGTIQASFLTIDEASSAAGFAFTTADYAAEPPPALAADPQTCAAAVGPGTAAVYTQGWTGFYSETFSDANGDHAVTEVLGAYPDASQAGKVFGALTDSVKGCTTAVRTDDDQGTTKWTYRVVSADTAAVAWTATEDAAGGWACYRQARLKGKALLQVAVCGAGDGAPAVAKIADQFAARVVG